MSAYAAGGSATGARNFSCLHKFSLFFLTSTVLSTAAFLNFTPAALAQTAQPKKQTEKQQADNTSGTLQLNTITVGTGTVGSGSYGTDAPNIVTIDRETIDRVQAASLPELVKQTPGVTMLGGVRIQGQGIAIRGFARQTDVRIIMDGAQKNFERYDQGTVFIEPELLKSVEIEKGATSIKYGNGGFGGTIKMETKDAADMLREGENWGLWSKTGYQTANKGWVQSGAVYGRTNYSGINFDGLAATTWRKTEDMRIGGGERYNFSDSKLTSFSAKGSASADGHELKATASYGMSENWGPPAAIRGQVEPIGSDVKKYGYYEAIRRRLAWRDLKDFSSSVEHKFNGDSDLINTRLMVSYAYTSLYAERPDGVSTSASLGGKWNESKYSDLRIEAENTSNFTLGGFNHSLNYGIQLQRHNRDIVMYADTYKNNANYNYGYFAPYNMPEGKQETFSAFVIDKIALTDQLTIIPGLRYDYVRSTGKPNAAKTYNDIKAGHDYSAVSHDGLTPGLSMTYDATSNLRLFADWAYAMRMPNIDELYSTQSAGTSLPRTSRDLEVERNNNFQIGVETIHNQLFTSDDQLKVRATAYYNHVTNPINRRFGSANAPAKGDKGDTYWNLPSYYSAGIEISAHYDTTYMFADAAFSTMHGNRHGALNNIYGYDTYLKDLAPATLVTTLGWKVPDYDLTLGWTGTFVARQSKTPHNQNGGDYARPESAGYGIHDLFLTWAPQSGMMKDAKLDIGLDNIFDKNYEPYLSDGITAMPGRNFKVSLSKKF